MSKTPGWLFYFSLSITLLTWLLIILGGVVHNTGSSLACPDWPTCFGSLMPEMKGGVLIEHSHRLVASAVGFLIILLNIFTWKWGDNRLKKLVGLALILVIFQGVLGGITVLYRLPTLVSTAHLATSMIFFALLIGINFLLWNSPLPEGEGAHRAGEGSRGLIGMAALMLYLQIVLGALVRHLGAGLACVDIPLCQGSLWPANAPGMIQLHMAHRLFAVLVTVIVSWAALKVYIQNPGNRALRILSLLMPTLLLMQIGLGLWSIHSALGIIPVTAHLGLGALIWAVMMIIVFRVQASACQTKKGRQAEA